MAKGKTKFREGYQRPRRSYKGHGTIRYRAGRATARKVNKAPETAYAKTSSTVSNTTVGGSDAQGIIVTSAVIVFALAFLNSYIVPRKTPRIRLFIGVGIVYIGLSVVAQFNPKLARSFAILIMVTAILAEGGGVLNWLLGRGSHDHLGISSTGTPNLPPIKVKPVPLQALPPGVKQHG